MKEANGNCARNGYANGHLPECAEEDPASPSTANKPIRRSQRVTGSPSPATAVPAVDERDSGNPGSTSDSQSSSEESEGDADSCAALASANSGIATHLGPVIANPELFKQHAE